jgi:hypothetical protein
MSEIKTIHIPGNWETPKYSLGLPTKQGLITGVEYNPPGTATARKYGEGWYYTVIPDIEDGDTETLQESRISLLTPEELQALIETYQNNIAALTAQLKLLEAERSE